MKLFTKNTFRTFGLSLLGAMLLSSCGGGGSCAGCSTSTPATGDITLTLTAPNQYPAGVAVTAYLTMTNTSVNNASNLYYSVPDSSNYTGATITVANGVGNNPCVNIAAGQSCTFPAQISADSHPGSFTVTATPNGSSVSGTAKRLWNTLKSDIGLQANTLSLTANIGLTSLPASTETGANGISFLYSPTIAKSESGDTLLSVVAVVNSASAGSFNTINLTTEDGTPLDFSVLSGNSGTGASALVPGSIVTFLLHIPSSVGNSYQFYANTFNNGTLVNQGTIVNPINLVSNSSQGVLVVQPTSFALSAKTGYESQVITYSNIGNGSVTGLTMPTVVSPLAIDSAASTCGSSLAPANTIGSSCVFVVKSNAGVGTSGQGSLTATSTVGGSVVSNYTYEGLDPIAGVTITSGSNPTFNFTSNTESPTISSQITLTNTGNVSESNFTFTVPTYFSLTAGTTGTACAINGNVVTTILSNHNDNCTLTLTYTNSTIVSGGVANLLVNYKYHGNQDASSSVGLTYSTDQAVGTLEVVNPLPLPYTFPDIIADNRESATQVFTIKNVGTGTAYNITSGGLQGPAGVVFTIIPSDPVSEQCGAAGGKTTLAPLATCLMTVRFGPIAQEDGLRTKNMLLNYDSYLGVASSPLSVAIQGTLIEPLRANPVIDSITNTSSKGGNGESANSAFAFESSNTSTTFTLTYKNIGESIANNFTVSTQFELTNGYTVNANNCNDVNLAINATCTVTLDLPIQAAGSPDLNVTELFTAWNDEGGSISGVPSSWMNSQGTTYTAYVTVYSVPSVTAVLSTESTVMTLVGESVVESTDFYAVYTLTGGYNVGVQTYGVNLSGATGGSPSISIVGDQTCTLSGQQPSCAIKLNSGAPANDQVIAYTTTGSISPTPSSDTIDVIPGISQHILVIGGVGYETDAISRCEVSRSNGSLTACNTTPENPGWEGAATNLAFVKLGNLSYAYVTLGNNQLYLCNVSESSNLENCAMTTVTGIAGGNYNFGTMSVTSLNEIPSLYIAVNDVNTSDVNIYRCPISSDASLGTCSDTLTAGASGLTGLTNVNTLTFENINGVNYAYMTAAIPWTPTGLLPFPGWNGLIKCNVNNSSGNLEQCANTINGDLGGSLYGLAFNRFSSGLYSYVGSYDSLYYCPVNASGDVDQANCVPTPAGHASWKPNSIAYKILAGKSYAYVAGSNKLEYCQTNSDGSLSNCAVSATPVGYAGWRPKKVYVVTELGL